ncbi:MAG: hypothetical protein R6V45_10100 [Oceanipulchritudo sp.]
MNTSPLAWKPNWPETRQRLIDWWNGKGLVIGMWGSLPAPQPREALPEPEGLDWRGEAYYMAGAQRARIDHYTLSRQAFPADFLPVKAPDMGPGSLCLHVGGDADFSQHHTVWFKPVFAGIEDVTDIPDLVFTGQDPFWLATEDYLREAVRLARGRHLVAFPDLCNDMDILASLRDPNQLLLDLLDEPEWVHAALKAVNRAYKAVYRRIEDIVNPHRDEGTASRSFYLWSPGRTAKLQCDTSAMFSRDMFAEFVTPRLDELCQWCDYPLYHLDGTNALHQLDELLRIDGLRAIEWTPQSGKPGGGDPVWFDMYRRILESGKALQIINIQPREVPALLNAIGSNGIYLFPAFSSLEEVDQLQEAVKPLTNAASS